MGTWEKWLLIGVVKWLLRWLSSNEKNRDKNVPFKKKGNTSK